MTKTQARELISIERYLAHGMTDTAARALSALIRASLSGRTTAQLLQHARAWHLTNHPEFII